MDFGEGKWIMSRLELDVLACMGCLVSTLKQQKQRKAQEWLKGIGLETRNVMLVIFSQYFYTNFKWQIIIDCQ